MDLARHMFLLGASFGFRLDVIYKPSGQYAKATLDIVTNAWPFSVILIPLIPLNSKIEF